MGYGNQGLAPDLASARAKRINVRSKGRRGEQEVAILLRGVLTEVLGDAHGIEIKRNSMQWGSKPGTESDILGLDWLNVEVKRVESDLPSSIDAWWKQCKGQAHADQTPALFYRMNSREWIVRTQIMTTVGTQRVKLPVDMAWSIFRIWLMLMIKDRMGVK